jgi:hypothetical protein
MILANVDIHFPNAQGRNDHLRELIGGFAVLDH